MSRLRYENKKTGAIQIYEIIPNEFTPSGAPKRKYLGVEGPDGELIPSTGKRGRRPGFHPSRNTSTEKEYLEQIRSQSEEIQVLKKQVSSLEKIRSNYSDLIRSLERLVSNHTIPGQ